MHIYVLNFPRILIYHHQLDILIGKKNYNDEHIQPKLLTQISKGKPIVVLARTMTPACKKHIIEAGIRKYLIFESADDTHTKVYGNGWEEVYEGQYWLLDNFLEIW